MPLVNGCAIAPVVQQRSANAEKCHGKLYAQYAQLMGEVCLVTAESGLHNRQGL